jgi:hypothetical protein
MDSNNIFEQRIALLKESLDFYLKSKDNEEIEKWQKGKLITELSNQISKSQYAIAEDLKGENSKKLLVQLIKANNSLPKRDRHDIWCPYTKDFEIDEPFFKVLEENGLVKSYYEKAINYSINPEDYRLNKIMEDIVGQDDLRPMMQSINYKVNSAIGTDAHKLLHVTGYREGNFEDGTYYPIKKIESDFKALVKKFPNQDDLTFDSYKKERFKLDGNYPNYIAVLPNEPVNKVNVNIPLLYSLLNNFIANNLLNLQTFVFQLDVLDSENNNVRISLNAELIVQLFKSFLLIGMKDMQMCFSTPSKGVIFTEVGLDWEAYTKESILTKTNFGLAMPVLRWSEDVKAPVVKINENGSVDLIVNTNVSSISKESVFSKLKKETKTPVVAKVVSKKADDYLKGKINAFELLLEIETDKNEIKFLKDKIEAFKMLSELE